MFYDNGGLRYIRRGSHEILRRIYAAVRDRNWLTVPATVSVSDFEAGDHSFRILFESEHRAGEIDFVWRGEITGDETGGIRFIFDGRARSTFLRNRIGLCVLHPAELAGAPCRLRYANGSEYRTTFPEPVAAQQPVEAIHDLGAIAHEVEPGVWAEATFSGDLFEMEDQRNWIDASFKTYCTPLRLPFPLEITEGTRVRQSVELCLHGATPMTGIGSALRDSARQSVVLSPTEQRFPLPPIGFGLGSHPMSAREIERLTKLKPAHLRLDLKPAGSAAESAIDEKLAFADEASRLLATRLEIALFLGKDAEAELKTLAALIDRHRPTVARWLIFDANAKATTARSLQLARQVLEACGAPIGGGTNADFYQLNQFRPPSALMDFVAFSMNPQTHAVDDASLVEALTVIPHPIHSARRYFDDLPVVVSSVTLKPRFNPVATAAEDALPPDQLPPQVDVRQMSLFGAAWTLGAVKRLTESRTASITCFETTGWRGVMETETGSPLPQHFPSLPDAVFPLYHVLADIAEFAGGDLIAVRSSDPLKVEAMIVERDERRSLLLANLTEETQIATIDDIDRFSQIRRLDRRNAEAAMRDPEAFRRRFEPNRLSPGRIELSPFEIVRLNQNTR